MMVAAASGLILICQVVVDETASNGLEPP